MKSHTDPGVEVKGSGAQALRIQPTNSSSARSDPVGTFEREIDTHRDPQRYSLPPAPPL